MVGLSDFLFFVGGIVVSWFFYRLALKDSGREARDLRRLSIMMMNAMEASGDVRWARDENGDPTGRLLEVSARLQTLWNVQANPTVTSKPTDRENQDQRE